MHLITTVSIARIDLDAPRLQELLDLFQLSPATQPPTGATAAAAAPVADLDGSVALTAAAAAVDGGKRTRGGGGSGLRGVLETVGELWSAEEYEEEYDLQGFLATLGPRG